MENNINQGKKTTTGNIENHLGVLKNPKEILIPTGEKFLLQDFDLER